MEEKKQKTRLSAGAADIYRCCLSDCWRSTSMSCFSTTIPTVIFRELHGEIKRLEREKKENRDTLNKYYELNRLLLSDKEELERVAREKYGMQRPGEDVYIIE